MDEIKQWDVWYAEVKFQEGDQSKDRPVVVVDPQEMVVVALKVTSHPPRHRWGEYEIIRWESAGLEKESTVQVHEHIYLQPTDFRRKAGHLQPIDISAIRDLLFQFGDV